ncbi:hypothetical protein, partial [uncultured Eubacterium sp.]|uniref:hypothetical protein n=1 Tax=uncultured Eubacterium sp. TaxID=165185 RepID=UPI0025CEC307
ALLHAQIYAKKNEKNEEIWLFTPPLKEKKRTATLLPATEKIYMFLSSSPSVTKGKPFLFYSVKGSVRCHSHKPIYFLIC